MALSLSDKNLFGSPTPNYDNLSPVKGNCPFGFFENDPEFVKDAKRVAAFVARSLGVGGTGNTTTYITDLIVYSAFEEAVITYGNTVYQYKMMDKYLNLEGSNTYPFIDNDTHIVSNEDVNIHISWSVPRLAGSGDLQYLKGLENLVNNNMVYVMSASISDFINPDLNMIKNFTFGSITYNGSEISLSRTVFNNYNMIGGATYYSNSVYYIPTGSDFLYFFTNDPNVNPNNTTLFPNNVIPTLYFISKSPDVALNNKLLNYSLQSVVRISEAYGTEGEVGGYIPMYTGSIDLIPYQQVYDLNQWAMQSASLAPGDRIEIRRIFYEEAPAMVRYFDPYAGTGTGIQSLLDAFGFGSFSPGVNFMLMPVYWDIQKIQAIEFNDQVRKSNFSFEIVNNMLRIFPVPTDASTSQKKLYFYYYKVSDKYTTYTDKRNYIVTDITNVPYENPVYSNINSIGRMWIFRYTLAICKEIEASVRSSFSTSGGRDVVANGTEYANQGKSEKEKLLDELKELLKETTTRQQLQRKQEETEYMTKIFNSVPLPIFQL